MKFIFAQRAAGSVFPSVCLELGDKSGDSSFHDGLCLELESKRP